MSNCVGCDTLHIYLLLTYFYLLTTLLTYLLTYLHETITTLGDIFNVPTVASKLIDDMKNDFKVARETLKNSAGHSLTAVSLAHA